MEKQTLASESNQIFRQKLKEKTSLCMHIDFPTYFTGFPFQNKSCNKDLAFLISEKRSLKLADICQPKRKKKIY